jgi:hypothetical protein
MTLDELDQLKGRFDDVALARKERLVEGLARKRFQDAASLIRFHEILLFLSAYPHGRRILSKTVAILCGFGNRVEVLRRAGVDLRPLEETDVSGIAGTGLTALFSYPMARHLAARHRCQVQIDWDGYQNEARLGAALSRVLPLFAEDQLVEANIPYRKWLDAAGARGNAELPWLLDVFRESPEVYESLALFLRWDLGDSAAARTRMRLPAKRVFYHRKPLIRRSEVSIEGEAAGPPIPMAKIPTKEGAAILDVMRDTSAVRYRELHGFNYGDPAHMLRAELGRGVVAYLCGVPPERRLPLRAYHAAMFFKNGVPIGYFEGLSLAERMEVGFNLYYTFRDGETAWLYVRLLHLVRQWLGVTCYVVDPYQIGKHNEEAIESGAFWFYRKLGFRPVGAEPARLAAAEERKIATRPGYRTPARVLRKLAESAMIYESPGNAVGDWDRFEVRKLGFAVAGRMEKGGDWERLVPGLNRVLRLKNAPEEVEYLRKLQRSPRVRAALIRCAAVGW